MIPKQRRSAIPLLGCGTYKLTGEQCVETVRAALDIGYRHFDTADVYGNHHELGKAVKGVPREEIFLTTKLFTGDLTEERVISKTAQFLKELKVDYIDLLLIHWPNKEVPLSETLEAMLRCKEEGKVKAIGVSNFVIFHLEELEPYLGEIAVNQIEMHPYLQRKELRRAYGATPISITAYRPLAKGAFESDETLKTIGGRYGKSPSQVALRWLVQNDIAAIPKASSPSHLKDNLSIFDFSLTNEELAAIDRLDCGKRYCTPENLPVYAD